MLTADLVRAYRRQGELRIRAWKGEARPNAERIARRYRHRGLADDDPYHSFIRL